MIIPAIDLKNRSIVRLYQGDMSKVTIYSQTPLDIVKHYISLGVEWLHIIDLDGAKNGSILDSINLTILKEIIELCKKFRVKLQIGGGIRTKDSVLWLLNKGVDKIILSTMAFENVLEFKELLQLYSNKIIIALDVFDETVMIKGWKKSTKKSIFSVFNKFQEEGIETFLVTDISRDGTGLGPNIDLYNKLSKTKKIQTTLIASGGIKEVKDILSVLKVTRQVVVGKALLTGSISNDQLKELCIATTKTNLTKRIIPCLDVKEGKVVKGINFVNLKVSGDPVNLARYYCLEGADELVFLDISATLEGRKSMLEVITKVAEEVKIPFIVGGGIRTIDDITNIIKAGAEKVSLNSATILNPHLITIGAQRFGSQCIVVAIDVKKINDSWKVYAKAGTEETDLDAIEWAKEVVERGAGELLVTSIDRDGTKLGYDLELLNMLAKNVNVPIIASGGAGKLKDFYEAINAGAEAVLAASLFHNEELKIKEVKNYLQSNSIKVRT